MIVQILQFKHHIINCQCFSHDAVVRTSVWLKLHNHDMGFVTSTAPSSWLHTQSLTTLWSN